MAPHTAVQLCSVPSSAVSLGDAPGTLGPRPPVWESRREMGRPGKVRANGYSSNSKVLSLFNSLPQIWASQSLPSTSLAFTFQNQLTSPLSLFLLPPLFLHLTLGIKEIASVDRVNTRRPACSTSSWLQNSGFLERGQRGKKKIRSWDVEGTMRKRKGTRRHSRLGTQGSKRPHTY